jgi:hypothetical protein
MAQIKNKKCHHCSELFLPDPRNASRQKYCVKPECHKARQSASQKKWLKKPENQDYFRGSENVERVREWREKNPGYWKKKKPEKDKHALQDSLNHGNDIISVGYASVALQDSLNAQQAVLTGLIAHLTGNALQDDIAKSVRHMQELGQDIINHSKGGANDFKTSCPSGTHSPDSRTIQLGGSPAGPGPLY